MNKINKIYLSLGKACNMACSYCIQGGHQKQIEQKLANAELKRLVSFFPKDYKCEVIFFGGEPLLYWEDMHKLAYYLKEHNPLISLNTVSNGTLLTKNKAKILNEMGIKFRLSHDGHYYERSRGIKDILKINPEPYLTLENRGIASVISRENYNFYDIWGYFDNFVLKHGISRKESVYIKHVEDAENNTPVDLFIYEMPEYEAMLDMVFANMEKNILEGDFDCYEFKQYEPFLVGLNHRLNNPHSICAMCGGDKYNVHMDVQGNIYTCHNVEKPYTTAQKEGRLLTGNYNPYINTETCKNCIAFVVCGGGCVSCDPTKKKFSCYITKQEYTRIVKMLDNIGQKGGLAYDQYNYSV